MGQAWHDHGPRDRPWVALTFDDGPGDVTAPLLAALGDARATFFLHGAAVARRPAVVRATAAAGHELGNHALTHVPLRGRPVRAAAEVLATQALVVRAAGVRPRRYRPPYGAGPARAPVPGLTAVGWDVDPRDWERPGAGAIAARVLAQVRPGSVVLLHDGRGDRTQTLAAVPRILVGLEARGLVPVPLSRLLQT